MRRLLAAALALAAAPALAQGDAPPPPDDPAKIVQSPTEAEMGVHWPKDAQGKYVEGRVLVACRVDAAGALSGCRAGRETPAGSGLTEAGLKIAPMFKVAPARRDGAPVESSIVFPLVNFEFDKPADWLRKPRTEDLLAVYPSGARGRAGRTIINCLVSVQGALSDCVPIAEDPPGVGFGAAGVALTPQLLMRPAQRGGKPVLSIANIPLKWEAAEGPAVENTRKVVSPVSVWLEAPTVADMTAAYPAKARAQKLGGRATVACKFDAGGRLTGCNAVTVEPKNLGFADAARDLAKKFLASPVEGQRFRALMVQIPVTFDPEILAGEPVVGKPSWAAVPTADEMAAAMAALPKDRGSVRVMLSCRVEQQGLLSGCTVKSEDPAGQGFGQAALALSPKFRLSTWTNDGLPVVGGRVNIPLRFDTGAPQAAAGSAP